MGELSVFRTQDANYFAFSNRKPKNPPSWDAPTAQDDVALSKKDLEDLEIIEREELEANLPLTDPVAYERMQIDALNRPSEVVTAEDVSALDEEELP